MGQGSLLEDHLGFFGTCLGSKCKVDIWGWTTHFGSERGGGQREKGLSVSFGGRRAKLQFLLATYWSGSTQITWTQPHLKKKMAILGIEKASVSCLLAVRANPPAFPPSGLLQNTGPVWASG